LLLSCCPAVLAFGEDLHFSYLWHLEQPIYWPDQQVSGPDRYERAWESIQRTDQGAAHPENDLREIFTKPDRVAVYQYRVRDTIDAIRGYPEAGAQVSYSGGLIENIMSLGEVGQLGYTSNWYASYRQARSWSTVGNAASRCDIVVFPFHHPLLPLCDDNTVRKELQLYKAFYAEAWGDLPEISRGLFPPEMAFSTRLIQALAEEGIDWVIVSGEHLSRACPDFPVTLGSGGINCDPPNPADQVNPPQGDYFCLSISRGCAPCTAAPFGYTPQRAQHVDPDTGAVHSIIVVPAAQALGWNDGYAPLGLDHFDALNVYNDVARPSLVLLAHDGDNAWGGGFSYYAEATPNLVSAAQAAGYTATVVEEYLADHPVPVDAIVHVEDGAWVNADGDFGSPVFLNWNWPLVNAAGQIDIANGWAEDERNWAVITAAQNRVDTAEQIAGGVDIGNILHPDGSTTAAERAWHYFLGALNSGYMYYGTALDMEVKPSIACNEAVEHADVVIGDGALDQTPPTIWIPQRHPWNPGGLNFGPQYGYNVFNSNGDFWIWTFAYDVSGVIDVTLKYRIDQDGANPLSSTQNETYAGGGEVGAWQTLPMTFRDFPAGNFFGSGEIDFFEVPDYIADQYYVNVLDLRDVLIDYYIEATDGKSLTQRSPIQHVYIGDGSGSGGGGDAVAVVPDPPQAGEDVTVTYDPAGRPLNAATQVFLHYGFNGWDPVASPDVAMTWNGNDSVWEASVTVSSSATQFDVVFNDGAGNWDNNNGQDWHYPVDGGTPPPAQWVMDGQRDGESVLLSVNGSFELFAGMIGDNLYVATQDTGEGNDHFIFVADVPATMREAPWDKAGLVADWTAFLAQETDNGWTGWFDTAAATTLASGNGNGFMEGTINLADALGSVPSEIALAVGHYPTADNSVLIAAEQVPSSVNGDGNLDAPEYIVVPTDDLFDEAICGDGTIDSNEDCDDSGESAMCDADCTFAACGDGTLNDSADEECDDAGASASCDPDCTFVVCGDGVLNVLAGEACDDNNNENGDGCNASCVVEGSVPAAGSYGLFLLLSGLLIGGTLVFRGGRAGIPT
jgi:cysteine-rich repeat protein